MSRTIIVNEKGMCGVAGVLRLGWDLTPQLRWDTLRKFYEHGMSGEFEHNEIVFDVKWFWIQCE